MLAAVLAVSMLIALPGRGAGQTSKPPTSEPTGLNRDMLSLLGGDVLAVYSYSPVESGQQFGQSMMGLLSAAGMLGVFKPDQQVLADTVSVIAELSKFPHVLALFDVASQPTGGEGSFRLDHFSMALLVQGGDYAAQLSLLKKTIDHYFDSENATISWVGEGAARRQRLVMHHMPEWDVWEWGQVGDLFVFTVGPGAYERIIANAAAADQPGRLTDVPMIQRAELHDQEMDHRLWLLYLNVQELDRKLQPVLGEYYDQVLAALKLSLGDEGNARQVILTAGYRQRAFVSKLYTAWPDRAEYGYLTIGLEKGDPLLALVPPEATSYAVASAKVSDIVAWATNSYLSTRNPRRQERMVANYERVVAEAGLDDVYAQLFDHLGPEVIIHDWPAHPFNWPFAKTILVSHDGSLEVRKVWPRVMGVWQRLLNMLNAPEPNETGLESASWGESLFQLQLNRTEEGIWFLHVGPLVLAAGAMTDQHLVISWSAPAVAHNMAYLRKIEMPTSRPAIIPAP